VDITFLIGKRKNDWQDIDTVLSLFGKTLSVARKRYRVFVEKALPWAGGPS